MSNKYTVIGKINKPSGTIGELKITLDDIFWDDFIKSDHFFVKINGAFVPYFIEDIRSTNHLIIKIEELDDPQSAMFLVNKEIFLPTHSIHSEVFARINEKIGFEGFTIFDNGLYIGLIEKIELMPQQVIGWVNFNEKKIPIPLVEGLILSIDQQKKEIQMNLPEGILNL